MEIKKYIIDKDLTLFCKKAVSFPDKVKEAFQYLHGLFPFDQQRMQFGLSHDLEDGSMEYWAAYTELVPGEMEGLGLEKITLLAGEYQYVVVQNYMQNISSIGQTFQFLSAQEGITDQSRGYELYISMEEVWCMMK